MLVYIIDAFNLLYKIPDLKKIDSPHNALIFYIKKHRLTGSKNNRVILVFDGAPPIQFREKEFEIIFSREKTADQVIKEILDKTKNRSQVRVISDDREIIEYAKFKKVVSLCVEEFIKINRNKNKEDIYKKDISYSFQKEINDELRKIWLKE